MDDAESDATADLLEIYEAALPDVYGYLYARSGRRRELAEDLTAETFLAAVDAVRTKGRTELDVAWLIGVARHKLADHWRREARDQAKLHAVIAQPTADDDPWDDQLDRILAIETLDALAPHHRLALTLRYVDDLAVAEVARLVGRSTYATEALLVRARRAFRRTYPHPPEGGTP